MPRLTILRHSDSIQKLEVFSLCSSSVITILGIANSPQERGGAGLCPSEDRRVVPSQSVSLIYVIASGRPFLRFCVKRDELFWELPPFSQPAFGALPCRM